MTAVERLDDIEARMDREVPALDPHDRSDLRGAIAALRAVLAIHRPISVAVNRCRDDLLFYDRCPTVRAMTAALDPKVPNV